MKAVKRVVPVLVLVAQVASPAFAQFPGEPRTPYWSGYDPVAEMNLRRAYGAPNEIVREAQVMLRDTGYYAGPIDGVMGPDTKSAVWRFQKAKGLTPSGSLDRVTLAELGVGGSDAVYASPGLREFGTARSPDLGAVEAP